MNRRSPLIVLLALLCAAGTAADSGKDHERARAALSRGDILPLARILAIAAEQVPGDVIKVELENEHGRMIYELKILADSGRVREIELDARTGAVLNIEDD